MPEPKLVAGVRRGIEESGLSLNQLQQECGVNRSQLSRFMRKERDLTLEAAGLVCEVLGLGLAPKAKTRPRKRRAAS